MACLKFKLYDKIILLLFLLNFYNAENICELPNKYMFCSCDVHEHETTERISCFIYGDISPDDEIWDYFKWKRNTKILSFDSRIDNELKFVPTEMIQTLEKLKTITFRQSKLGILESYTFSKLVNVTSIQLTSNEITELQEKCFYRMHKLIKLELAENNIRRIPPNAFVDLPALQMLYLDRNHITKLEAGAFQNLKNLNELDLHTNDINKLEVGAFQGLEHLHRLDLFKNRLETLVAGVFSSLTRLNELDLNENNISKLEADTFKGLNNLITLHLRSNRITRLPAGLFKGVPKLMHIDLSNNYLERVRSGTIEEIECRYKDQFAINIEDNKLKCDCDLWWWTTEYLNKSSSLEWKRQLRNLKCKFPESNGTSYRIISLNASKIGCSEIRATLLATEKTFESPAVLVMNEIPSSESTSPQSASSQKQHALSDASQEKQMKDSTTSDASADYPVGQDSDSLATKKTIERLQSSHKGNSACYTRADLVLVIISLLLAYPQIYRHE